MPARVETPKASTKPLRILLADDHAIVIEGLRRILDRPDFEVIEVAENGHSLVEKAVALEPDVIIADIGMPLLNGIDAAREIRSRVDKAKIIFLTMHPELTYAKAALAAGASGYVIKSAAGESLIKAIRSALKGESYISEPIAAALAQSTQTSFANGRSGVEPLTSRQREVLQLLAEGKQVKEIATLLKISPKTAEFHKYRIMDLLGLRTVADLARYAQKHGIVA